ncbi:MAG: hypothetical protein KIT86_00570 [Hydrogenophaga sp.]|jgi:hypothetical protein|uniref:hypothetical protein n=1 Tax=Hydrogenophaga sp. TaxID=1904254 RepID=UPI002638D3E1|nr:hypothetical protein [Hydrogenophaga sp.]MCW5668119.1 hypothetical protein [Hydrogenophaga sp.]
MRSVLIAAVILSGCAAPQLATVNIESPFDATQAKLQTQDGLNSIKGSGFLRQRGGGVVTCAGSEVVLIPATYYARERIAHLYGTGGINRHRLNPTFVPDPPEYRTFTKKTRCDAQGNFMFERVADGDFFVTTGVHWQVGGTNQGGPIMSRARVAGGETINIVISGD